MEVSDNTTNETLLHYFKYCFKIYFGSHFVECVAVHTFWIFLTMFKKYRIITTYRYLVTGMEIHVAMMTAASGPMRAMIGAEHCE